MAIYNKPRSLEDVNQTWSNINNKINSVITPSPQALQSYSPEYQARYRQPVISNIQPSVNDSNNISMRQLGGQIDMGPGFKYLQTPIEDKPTIPLADYSNATTTSNQTAPRLSQQEMGSRPMPKLDMYGMSPDLVQVETLHGMDRGLGYYNPENVGGDLVRQMNFKWNPEGNYETMISDTQEPQTEYGKTSMLQAQKENAELARQRLVNQEMRATLNQKQQTEKKYQYQGQNDFGQTVTFDPQTNDTFIDNVNANIMNPMMDAISSDNYDYILNSFNTLKDSSEGMSNIQKVLNSFASRYPTKYNEIIKRMQNMEVK